MNKVSIEFPPALPVTNSASHKANEIEARKVSPPDSEWASRAIDV
jgi:hypothetical protein